MYRTNIINDFNREKYKRIILEKAICDTETRCWNWNGALRYSKGIKKWPYGIVAIKKLKTSVGAHRISYEVFIGAIPSKHFVCHKCDNTKCINPDHLFTGTQFENLQDAISKNRIQRGEGRYNAVVTEEIVRQIRKDYIPFKFGYIKVAKKYGIKTRVVQKIIEGETWKHVI